MSQVEKIKLILEREGQISRNTCLKMYISRLAAIIAILKKTGMEFETEEKDGDYIYRLVDRSRDRVQLDLATNNYKLKYV